MLCLLGVGTALSIQGQRQPALAHLKEAKAVAPGVATKSASAPAVEDASISAPKRLRIPKINVDAKVRLVGLTKSGDIESPKNYQEIGWYQASPIPGKPGNAIMSGHLDLHGKPAVFWDLNKLKEGDSVEVIDDLNRSMRFKVVAARNYKVAEAPRAEILGPTTKTRLNLITCSGKWDKKKKDYEQRLVVYTELIR